MEDFIVVQIPPCLAKQLQIDIASQLAVRPAEDVKVVLAPEVMDQIKVGTVKI